MHNRNQTGYNSHSMNVSQSWLNLPTSGGDDTSGPSFNLVVDIQVHPSSLALVESTAGSIT